MFQTSPQRIGSSKNSFGFGSSNGEVGALLKNISQKVFFLFFQEWMKHVEFRTAMIYGVECWPTKRQHVQQLSVAEMRILRWFCEHKK